MILKTTLELFKGDGVYCTDHLDRSRLASRSYRLSNGSNRLSRIGTIHCKRLSITKTGMHGGTKARAVLSPVSDPAASLTKKECKPEMYTWLILSVDPLSCEHKIDYAIVTWFVL
ncbi:hypothetical protein F2Q69_00034541 [Brassica cretica]|uniref:Uncharacterized protein n=1 Tax=Brassica cretica TaxID=69181 RepID=A0A8S9SI44_BRACR|nr:hypothetical protein F2Q69_00034541 [Brassica cretica]